MTKSKKTKSKKETKMNESKDAITKNMLIGEVVTKHPETIHLLLEEGIHCVGCGAANMETLEEGLSVHGKSDKEITDIIKEMNKIVAHKNPANPNTINITDAAAKKIKELLKNEKKEGFALRIEIVSGGCSGFSYALDFDNSKKEGDREIKNNGIKIYVDKESFELLKGCEVDFIDSLHGSGFKIENPNAQSTCGCGDSFS